MEKQSNKSVVLLSGGLDSTVLLYYAVCELKHDVTALIFNYNQRHNRETAYAYHHALKLNCNIQHINAEFIGDITKKTSALTNTNVEVPHIKDVIGLAQPPTYVPMRNLMFLSIAAAVAESNKASTILYGAAEVDTHSGHWDCSVEFLDLINSTLNLNRENKITVQAPFIKFSKEQIIKTGNDLAVDFTQTHTCYRGEHVACGVCSSCSSRIQGFMSAGLKDPLQYEINIPW
jgi:7-cyano-7-deazaguanine synthase